MSTLKTTAIQHLNGSSPNIYLDSNNRVGIGTSSPTSLLEVAGNATNIYLRSNDSNDAVLRYMGSSSERATVRATAANNLLVETANLERFRIDASGRVTMPYQPSFSAKATGSGASASGTILFNEIDNNIGSHYSASTGRFTAPIAGRYLFSHFVLFSVGGTNTALSATIRKNGAAAVHPYTRSTGADYVSNAGTVILSLAAGDYVTVYVDEGTIYATGAAHNNFSGFLIG